MAEAPSTLLRHLPQILRSAGPGGDFIADYLKVFEAILCGRSDVPSRLAQPSLEGRIAAIPELLDPSLTPVDPTSDAGDVSGGGSAFLDYLASWVGLSFDQNWGLDKRREWLRRIVPMYKRRGTRAGLSEYLATFIGRQVSVEEPGDLIVGRPANATVGVNTFIGTPRYFFRVLVRYGYPPDRFDIAEWKNIRRGTRAIVDLEKPAHTSYTLVARTPGIVVGGLRMRQPSEDVVPRRAGAAGGTPPPANALRTRGRGATVGVDTLIWQQSAELAVSGTASNAT